MTAERDLLAAERKGAEPAFDEERVRADFPILRQSVHGHPLVYFDTANSSQKPQVVIDAVKSFYENDYANIHRGLYQLSERATRAYAQARNRVARFINARESREIIFLRGTTEAINLVASSYGRSHLGEGDEILITHMEHHSNIVPWQILCDQVGAKLRVVPIDDEGDIDIDEFAGLISSDTKIVAAVHISNSLGTVNPVREMIDIAHRHAVPVLLDGAQAVPHRAVDVSDLDCDFYAFSGHKLYGPSGIGVLYGKAELLESMPPYHGGGDMIRTVTFQETTFAELPDKYEAGTPNVAGAVGLAAAIEYVDAIGMEAIQAHGEDLLQYADEALATVPGLSFVGRARERSGLVTFTLEGIHPHDIGTILDREGIAVRAGHHCAQPVMAHFNVPATVRVSFGIYNTRAEIDRLVHGIRKVQEILG